MGLIIRSVSGLTRGQLSRRTGLPVPNWSSRVPDGVDNPCRLVVTCVPRSNCRRLRVRCECMAQCQLGRSRAFYTYDHLADVTGLPAALVAWRDHASRRREETDRSAC